MNSQRLHLNHSITSQSAKGLTIRFCGLALHYLATVLAANCLGVGQFGIFSSVLSLSPIWAVLAMGGVDVLATKSIATASRGNPGETSRQIAITGAAGFFGMILGLVLVTTLWFIVFELGTTQKSTVFLYSLTIFPVMLLANLRQSIVLPLRGVPGAIFPEQIILPSVFGATIFVLAKYGLHADIRAIILVYFLTALGAGFVGLNCIWRGNGLSEAFFRRITFGEVFGGLKQGRPFYVSAVADIVRENAVTVLVSFCLGFKEAGLYFVVSRLSALPYIPLGVIDRAVMPAAARLYADEDRRGLDGLSKLGCSLGFVGGLVISIGIMIFHRPLLGMFSHEYESQGLVLLVLVLGQTANTFFGPNAALMKMTGLERLYSKVFMVVAVVLPLAVSVSAILGGVFWVAICSSTVLVGWNALLCWYLWQRRKLVVLPYRPAAMVTTLKEAWLSGLSLNFWSSASERESAGTFRDDP